MLNRRKAAIGWLAYTIGKPIVVGTIKRRARRAALAESGQGRGKTAAKWAGFLAGAAAAAGAVMFWRSRSEDDDAGAESDALASAKTTTPEPAATASTSKPGAEPST